MNRCLVIDDSRIMRKIARSILEDLSFDAAEAEDTDAALEYCRASMPELILLDFDLPSASGLEFLRKLRHEHGGERPVVVFCTTENDVLQISQALSAGANDYVQKPFDRATLRIEIGLSRPYHGTRRLVGHAHPAIDRPARRAIPKHRFIACVEQVLCACVEFSPIGETVRTEHIDDRVAVQRMDFAGGIKTVSDIDDRATENSNPRWAPRLLSC